MYAKGRISSNPELINRGKEYALAMADKMNVMGYDNLFVWTLRSRRPSTSNACMRGEY